MLNDSLNVVGTLSMQGFADAFEQQKADRTELLRIADPGNPATERAEKPLPRRQSE
jgi:hypothetical protein